MKILVLSDTHGDTWRLREIFSRERGFSLCVFLGDGERDLEPFFPMPDVPLLAVRGNCDFGSSLPSKLVTEEGGRTLFLTHGHEQLVKYGLSTLRSAAREANASVALYGHTHVPVQDYDDGLYLCNPGSVRNGDYAVLEIVPQGVMWLPRRIG